MAFIDDLKRYKQEDNTTLHEVLLNISSFVRTLHVFFEGKTDEAFYSQVISPFQAIHKVMTYKAGTKKSVYYFCENLHNRKNSHNSFVFYVDKDIDNLVPISFPTFDCLHETKYYSIENYVIETNIYSQIVSDFYRVGRGNELHTRLVSKFEQEHKRYTQGMLEIMAWVLFQKRVNQKIILQNINDNTLVIVDEDLNVLVPPLDSIVKELDRQTKSTTDLVEWETSRASLIAELKTQHPKEVIRGKFELHFFVLFCRETRRVIENIRGSSVRCSIIFDSVNAVDILAPRVTLPSSFTDVIVSATS